MQIEDFTSVQAADISCYRGGSVTGLLEIIRTAGRNATEGFQEVFHSTLLWQEASASRTTDVNILAQHLCVVKM